VHLFFTFWGFDMIHKKRQKRMKFSPVGNFAMHMPVVGTRVPQGSPGFPNAAVRDVVPQAIDQAARGPTVPDFLDQISAAGGHLHGCKMSADMNAPHDGRSSR